MTHLRFTTPKHDVFTMLDGMHLLVPRIEPTFVPYEMSPPAPGPNLSTWIVPQRFSVGLGVTPQAVRIIVTDLAAAGIVLSRRGYAPPRKRPKRIAKRLAGRRGRMHYQTDKEPTP